VTKDGGAVTQYISQQAPRRTEVYAVARRACVRSLSSELAPGRDGPLLFGDTQHGYAFSYTFTLRDTRARGGLRHYSFTLVMADAVHLVGCWPFLTRHLHVLVRDLKLRVRT
jgi:folliculin